MHQFMKDIWKAGIAIAGLMFFLVLMVWVPMSANAYEDTSGTEIAGPVQSTPTVDVTATMTALNEEKLRQEIRQLKSQNEPTLFDWFRSNVSILLSTLLVVGGGVFGLVRYLAERRDAQKRLLDHELISLTRERASLRVSLPYSAKFERAWISIQELFVG